MILGDMPTHIVRRHSQTEWIEAGLWLALGIAACGRGDHASRAESAGSPPTPLLTIRSDEATDHAFTVIGTVVPAGPFVYITQPRDQRILVYDSAGHYLRAIGRPGDGPGEFRFLLRVGLLGDSLWTVDGVSQRTTIFTPGGEVARSWVFRAEPPGWAGSADLIALLADGSALAEGHWSITGVVMGGPLDLPLVRASRTGDAPSGIATADLRHTGLHAPAGSGRFIEGLQPFDDRTLWAAAADGSAFAVVERPATGNTSAFHVTLLRPSGDTIYSRSYPVTPVLLTDAAFDSARAYFAPVEIDPAVVFRPARVPPVRAIGVGRQRDVWLRLADAPDDSLATWQAIDSTGEPFNPGTAPRRCATGRRCRWSGLADPG